MKLNSVLLILLALCNCLICCKAQPTFGTDYLKLEQVIVMPGVKGRIDHMDVNLKQKIVYISALGNNTVEVVDIENGKLVHSIKGLDEPQGVGYIPQTNEIFIANGGNGNCYFYNAASFERMAVIHLGSDADDVRYDSVSQKIYVGYGDGGIAVIDAATHQQTGNVKLPAHPEGFQSDKKANLLLVNLPDKNMIAAIDIVQLKLIRKWTRNTPTANFPMAVDTVHQFVFIGYRHPARLVILNSKTGKEIANYPMVSDVDDLYFDDATRSIYVSGGGGFINIFQPDGKESYKQIANIATSDGARTSLLIPRLKLFVVAERAGSGKAAQLMIYNTSR